MESITAFSTFTPEMLTIGDYFCYFGAGFACSFDLLFIYSFIFSNIPLNLAFSDCN